MRTVSRHTWLVFLGLTCALVSTSHADQNLGGSIGVNVESYGFTGRLIGTDTTFKVNRTLSDHFINLALSGPFISNRLANYSIATEFYGTYQQTTTDGEERNAYLSPTLNALDGQVTLFPNRPYPLRFYHTSSSDLSLRYESGNRSDLETLNPELAVIRRYEGEMSATGATLKAALSDKVNFTSDIKKDETKTSRIYDFDENRDIRIIIESDPKDLLKELDTLYIENELPDADVQINFEGSFNVVVPANSVQEVIVEAGFYNITVVPLTYYNQHRFQTEIRANATWSILFKEPAGGTDIDQSNTSGSLGLIVGSDEKLLNETSYRFSDQSETNQNLSTQSYNLVNDASYVLSNTTDLRFSTNYAVNKTKIDTLSEQTTGAFVHTSSLSYAKSRGLKATLDHSYSKNSSETGGSSDASSTLNTITNTITYQRRKFQHKVDVNNNVSLQSDNLGSTKNQYSSTLTNSMEMRLFGTHIKPKNETKYTHGSQTKPDQSTNEIETKFLVKAQPPESKYLGEVMIRTEYEYRRKSDGVGTDIKGKYLIGFSSTRTFGRSNKLLLMATNEWKTYGGSAPTTPGANPDQNDLSKPTEHLSSYKADLKLQPFEEVSIGGGVSLISQAGSKNTKYSLTLAGEVPYLNIPVKSYYMTMYRDIEGLPQQSQTDSETTFSFRFRQITLVMKYTYSSEKLITESFSYHELTGQLIRRFSLF